jgi:hypothetical protein
MSLESITLPVAAVRYRLDGPAGPCIDGVVAALIGAGITVHAITPGTAYRLDPTAQPNGLTVLDDLAEQMQSVEGYGLAVERGPSDVTYTTGYVAPAFKPRRTITVHGANPTARGFVARAVDRGLSVSTMGLNRWAVTGQSAALVAWLCQVWAKSQDEVLVVLSLTPEQLAAEDRPPASIAVALPDRRTETEVVSRDDSGNIDRVVHLETTV